MCSVDSGWYIKSDDKLACRKGPYWAYCLFCQQLGCSRHWTGRWWFRRPGPGRIKCNWGLVGVGEYGIDQSTVSGSGLNGTAAWLA